MSDGGKGSQQRPTDRQKFEENFERIFGKPKEKEKKWDLMITILIETELRKNGKSKTISKWY